jgi:high affinity sulfate transporter 1
VLGWLRGYDRRWLRSDLVAGLTSWALVVPQAVAYGQIAGLTPPAGLAAAGAGPLGYAMLGTSRQLMVSPTSSTAAVSAALVGPMSGGDPGRFVALSAALAIVMGAALALLGLLKMGFVSQFLAYSVQVGFMFGLGLTIAVGQLPKVLGIPAAPEEGFFPALGYLLANVGQTNPWTAALGLGGLAALLLLSRLAPRAPAAIIVVGAGILITAALGLSARGVATVGAIPPGLPTPALPAVFWHDLLDLAPLAIVLAILGYAESASVAQDLATRHGYDVDPDRELIALGAASGLAGLMQGFIVAGGASQSAANDRAGARTQAASLVVAGLAVLTALFLTPLFFDLPEAVLGAIVLYAILGFFRVGALRRIAGLRRDGFAFALFTLFAVLFLGVLTGLVLAVSLSLALLLARVARPSVAVLGRAPRTGAGPGDAGDPGPPVYGDLAANPELQALPGMLLVRPNGMVFFGSVRGVRQQVLDLARRTTPPPRLVLLDLQLTPELDVETADVLAELRTTLAAGGVELWLAGAHSQVRDLLRRSGYQDGSAGSAAPIYPGLAQAVEAAARLQG